MASTLEAALVAQWVERRCKDLMILMSHCGAWEPVREIRGPVSKHLWQESSLLKAVSTMHMTNFAAQSPGMVTAVRLLKNCSYGNKQTSKPCALAKKG
jgi:hypothetical protein